MTQEMLATSRSDLVSCSPALSWVDHRPYDADAEDAGESHVSNGVRQLLSDAQVDLRGPELRWHYRSAQRILTRAGAERVANFMVEFDPAFQRLEVHFICVIRGGARIEHADADKIQTFRRETNLQRLILDGRLTATLLIPDVRVGDIVEIAVTLVGVNPVLEGKYAAWLTFDALAPWMEVRHRIVKPKARELALRPFNDPPQCATATEGDMEDLRWRMIGQSRRKLEALLPPGRIYDPALQVSEFASWSIVARLFTAHYDSPEIPDDLALEIDRLAADCPAPDDRAANWLRFVQQHLRYFALSLGEGGLVPRPLATIWTSRLGDCKDAARLYVAGARRLGLDVCAALVSTTHPTLLDQLLPSPALFNHCIIRVTLNGKRYWLDPTRQSQSGNLANIYQAHTGWALPLSDDATALERLPDQDVVHCLHWDQALTVGPKKGAPAKLRHRIDYFSWVADAVRSRVENQGLAEFRKSLLSDLRNNWPEITEIDPPVLNDDPVNNRISVASSYEIAGGWQPNAKTRSLEFRLVDWGLIKELSKLDASPRVADIHLGRPRKLTRSVRMEMPRRWPGKGWHNIEVAPGVRYVDRVAFERRVIVSEKELEISASSLAAARVEDYRKLVAKLHTNVITIRAREFFGRIVSPAGVNMRITRLRLRLILIAVWLIGTIIMRLAYHLQFGHH